MNYGKPKSPLIGYAKMAFYVVVIILVVMSMTLSLIKVLTAGNIARPNVYTLYSDRDVTVIAINDGWRICFVAKNSNGVPIGISCSR